MTALVPLTAEPLAKLAHVAGQVGAIADVMPLETEADEAKAVALLQVIMKVDKEGEDARKGIVGPPGKAVREVNKLFKTQRDELLRVKDILKRRIGEAQQAREDARASAMALMDESVASGDTETAIAALAEAGAVKDVAHRGTSYTVKHDIILVNVHAVPREFMSVDVAKIKTALKANPDLQIDGVQITKRTEAVVRG